MIRIRGALPLLLAFAAVAAPVAADTHPNLQRGLDVAKSLQIGDIDHVNLFNGSLNLTIPIGQPFPVNGSLSYGLTLVNNSNVWDFLEIEGFPGGPVYNSAIPNPRNNAGLGWTLSFGHVGSDMDSGLLTYTGPDGSEHPFYDTLHTGETPTSWQRFTRDGSYLRMNDMPGGVYQLEFPGGEIHEFGPDGELQKIYDRFGNLVTLTQPNGLTWRISDPHGRVQQVNFAADAVLGKRVTSVVFTAFNGSTATYTFGYTAMTVDRPCPDNDPHTGPLTVNMLTSVTLPDSSSHAMPSYHLDQTAGCRTPGAIRSLTLPTLGQISWTYQDYVFPSPQLPRRVWRTRSNGVATRAFTDAAGVVLGTWQYATALDPTPPFHQLVNTVTTPLGHKTESYFSVSLEEAGAWTIYEYGLPLTHNVADATGNRFLSSRTYAASSSTPVRETYVRYERDAGVGAGGDPSTAARFNQRLASTRTVYQDDPVAGSPQGGKRFADEDSLDFDGLGHYRTVQTGGNFGAGNVRASYTRYNNARGTYPGSFTMLTPGAPWVLETFDLQEATEGVQTARRTFLVDAQNGWVSRVRTHRQSTGVESSQDTLVERLKDGDGNITSERFYGGDTQTVGTGSLVSLILPQPPQYRVDYTTQYGSGATAAYADASGNPLTFKNLDQTIDLNTGLPSSSRDTSGIETTYEYDSLGRLRFARPQSGHDGWTEYLYTRATSSTALAQVNVYQRPNGGGTALAEGLIKVDAFGRIWQEQQKMPNGSWSTRETLYNAVGWKASVSELGNTTKTTQYVSYDPFGRPAKITPPDGSSHEVMFAYVGMSAVGRSVKVRDVVNGEHAAWTSEISDRQGRLYQVKEEAQGSHPTFTNTTTTYSYDVGNRLTHVEQATAAGTQHRWFTYDQRGFLLSEQHPEKGANGNGFVFYANYDSRGHAGRKYDCSVQACSSPGPKADLTFIYDRAERIMTVSQAGVGTLKTFTYGSSNAAGVRSNGRLETATRYNYVSSPFNLTLQVDETYTYGGRQARPSRRVTQSRIVPSQPDRSFEQTWVYDALGNVTSLGYPNCTFAECPSLPRTVSQGHTQGRLTSVTGYASSITYHPNGMTNQVTHANGVIDTQANDPNGMARPASLSARRAGASSDLWSSGTYLYDGAGNVAHMGNSYFLYDHVNRLIDGRVDDRPTGGGTLRYQTYTYDPFGNLTNIGGDSWASGRSTPTSPATNRHTSASYDVPGNMVGFNGATFEVDGLGMMTKMLNGAEDWRYLYTAGDERFFEYRAGGGGANWALRDLDGKVLREFQEQAGWAPREYIYRGGQLLASSFTTEGVRHFSLDHLGTPRLITSSGGYNRGIWTGGASNCKAAPADYDGDGDMDLSLKCGPAWYFYKDDGSYLKSIWTGGSDGDVPVPVDYDGDGYDDVAAFNSGAWHFYDYATGAYHGVWTGATAGCLPAPADYDGDGNADLALKCGPVWNFYNDNGSYIKGLWTGATDSQLPVPGNYLGGPGAEPAISNGAAWDIFDYASGAHIASVWTGLNGTPIPMDYNGDGYTDVTVFSNGAWFAYRPDGSYEQSLWTAPNVVPLHGNFGGDLTEEPAIYAGGAWSIYSFAGMPIVRHQYFAFGEELSSTIQDAEQMKFTGHERDSANPSSVADDLDYMHARYYNPLTARFLSVDPVSGEPKAPQSWNRYAYVRNNPLRYIDPDGRSLWKKGIQVLKVMADKEKRTVLVAAFRGKSMRDALNRTRAALDTVSDRTGAKRVVEVQTASQRDAIAKGLSSNGKMRGPETSPGYPEHGNPAAGPYADVHVQVQGQRESGSGRAASSVAGGATAAGILGEIFAPTLNAVIESGDPSPTELATAAAWDVTSSLDPLGVTDLIGLIVDLP